MGSSSSKASHGDWQPSPPGGATERKISKSGYDITPLKKEDVQRYSAALTPFQRLVQDLTLVQQFVREKNLGASVDPIFIAPPKETPTAHRRIPHSQASSFQRGALYFATSLALP